MKVSKNRTRRKGGANFPLFDAVLRDDISAVNQLITEGANVNETNEDGKTSLHVAVIRRNMEIIEALLSAPGIQVNRVDTAGYSPLHLASLLGHRAIVSALLHAGADPTIQTLDGNLPIDLTRSEAIRTLLRGEQQEELLQNLPVERNEENSLLLTIQEGDILVLLNPVYPDQRIVVERNGVPTEGWNYLLRKRMNPLSRQPLDPYALEKRRAVIRRGGFRAKTKKGSKLERRLHKKG